MPLRDIDRQLLDRCLKHEPGAWNDFVDRYMGLIYHVIDHTARARSLDLSSADMEDVAADVLLQIVDDDYRLLRNFKAQSSLPTYLTVVARRICVKQLVRRRREESLGHAHAHRAATFDDDESGEIEPILAADQVDRLLKELPDREAKVVKLYHLDYLNYRQIGQRLGIPENSVGPLLARARQHLREFGDQAAVG